MAEQARNFLNEIITLLSNAYFTAMANCVLSLIVASVAALLFYSLRRQIHRLRSELEAEHRRSEASQEVGNRLEELQLQIETLNERTVPPGGWASIPESVHLNRRGQVLKLHRGGHPVWEIASNLGISQGEVRLTLKLQGLLPAATADKADESPLIAGRIRDRNTRGLLVKEAS